MTHIRPSAPSLISVWVPQFSSPNASTDCRASSTILSCAPLPTAAGVMPARSVNGATVGIRPLRQTGRNSPSTTAPSTLT